MGSSGVQGPCRGVPAQAQGAIAGKLYRSPMAPPSSAPGQPEGHQAVVFSCHLRWASQVIKLKIYLSQADVLFAQAASVLGHVVHA